jgi:Ca2+-binding EF-hand superfamily protein
LLLTLDTNGDGQWDRDEFSRLVKLFDKLDSDHDGRVNSRELFGDRSTPNNGDRPASRQSRSRNSRESDAPRPNTPTRQRSTASTPFLIRRLDRDQDGKISKDEAQGRLRENFEKLDTDGNGFLNPSEIQKAASDRNRPQRSTRSEPGRETDRPRRERRPPQ